MPAKKAFSSFTIITTFIVLSIIGMAFNTFTTARSTLSLKEFSDIECAHCNSPQNLDNKLSDIK